MFISLSVYSDIASFRSPDISDFHGTDNCRDFVAALHSRDERARSCSLHELAPTTMQSVTAPPLLQQTSRSTPTECGIFPLGANFSSRFFLNFLPAFLKPLPNALRDIHAISLPTDSGALVVQVASASSARLAENNRPAIIKPG